MKVSLILLSLLAGLGWGLYDGVADVVMLTKDNFASQVFSTEHVWVVEFFAPWCGHCKHFAPEYAKAAQSLRGIVKVGAVNCDEQKEVCGAFSVQGFPTIKLFPSELTKTDKGYTKVPADYNSARSAAALANAATALIPNFAQLLTAANEEKFFSGNEKMAKVVLFTDKDKTPLLYKALAVEFRRGLEFGEIRSDQRALVKRFNVNKFPTVLVVPAAGAEPVAYSGSIQFEPIKKFLLPYAKAPQREEPKNPEPPKEEPIEQNWDVVRITSTAGFKEACIEGKVICVLAVLDPYNFPDEQDQHENTLVELAEKYKGRAHFMWLGVAEQPELIKALDLRSGFPALVAINPRLVHGKTRFTRFVGSFDLDSVSNFLESVLFGRKGSVELEGVPPIVDVNLEDFKIPPPEAEEEYEPEPEPTPKEEI
jgi:protein disulfide-isomerase A6